MTKQKAEKHLRYSRESLEFWREEYVHLMRNEAWKGMHGTRIFQDAVRDTKNNISEAKERIARFERIVL